MEIALQADEARRATRAGTLAAGLLVAQMTAGRAVRDALFLSSFPVTWVPAAMIASACASMAAVVGLSWLLARRAPFRVLPAMAGTSAVLLLLQWALGASAPRAAAVTITLHLAVFGAALISGFWSLVSERFDPHTARRVVARIALGASLGGVAGGALAWVAAHVVSVPFMLLVMAVLNVAAMAGMRGVGAGPVSKAALPPAGITAPLGILRRVTYLRDLAIVVALGAVTDALLDYVLKSQAAATFRDAAGLLSFFAVCNAGFGLLTLVLQLGFSRAALQTLGLAGTAALRPLAVCSAAVVGIFDPRLGAAVLARAAHEGTSASLFRSGYELLFTPLPEDEKRPTKAVVDVGFDKLGSLAGGTLVLIVAGLLPNHTTRALFVLAALLGLAALAFTRRLHHGYVRTLEQSLRAGRIRLDESEVEDEATRLTLARTSTALDRATLMKGIALHREAQAPALDALLPIVTDLRSPEAAVVRGALQQMPAPPAAVVGHVIPLLARDDLFVDVLRTLRRVAPAVTGQLLDALLDETQDARVRRRLPRVLKACLTRRAVDGLTLALPDPRFEIRAQCALALESITARAPELAVSRAAVLAALQRELDHPGGRAELDHVFTLLSLVFEREPLHIALQALRGSDGVLRGTALEYLENILPPEMRLPIARLVGAPSRGGKPATRAAQELTDDLMGSTAAVAVGRRALRARLRLGRRK